MAKPPTIQEFMKQFPDDDACLDYLMQLRHGEKLDCPKCGKHGKFHRIKRHPAYECAWCGFEIFPMVGTMFHRSHTPLQKWFYAMYLFTTSRHGVPAKELQRQLGVSYPTAFRMAHKIREYMGAIDGQPPLTGHVEVDETYIGGRVKGGKKKGITGRGANKTIVMGILERDGQLFTKVIPDASRRSLIPPILENVPEGTRVSSDEWHPYKMLKALGYDHRTVEHGAKQYANGDTHVNGLESFWSILKRSIKGTHVHVSRQHLQKYLGEFEYRYNLRKAPDQMFVRLLASL
ncbi:MAG: IS1595 family transposase [Proteobacteria bacterium]|nr:IS1595 family transposase [Pseudomonadota bacterium]